MSRTPAEARAPARRQPGGPPKGDRRRQAILDAIEQLLGERPIAALSVEDIAAAAGISRSGFYFYFESKYAALGAVLREFGDEVARATEVFFGGEDLPPEEYVRRELRGVGELWQRHARLMIAVVDAAHNDAGVRMLWEAWLGRFFDGITARIVNERESGRAPDGPPAPALARALMLLNVSVFDDLVRNDRGPEALLTLEHVWMASLWGRTAQPAQRS